MSLEELMEKLVDKVKKEGQAYVPPAIKEDSPRYLDSLYHHIKEGRSVAYSMVINGFWLVLEEQPCHDNPQKPWTRSIDITSERRIGYKAGCFKVYSDRLKTTWLGVAENHEHLEGFNSFEELVASLC